MRITEICSSIVTEMLTKAWAVAPDHLKTRLIAGRLMEWGELTDQQSELIADFLTGGDGEPVAAKKIVKRKPRKAKAAPLTQHAEFHGIHGNESED